MNPAVAKTALLAAVSVLAFVPATAVPAESPSDEAAVKAAHAKFYEALNAMFKGDLGPMKQVWSHADDVTYMGPGGGFKVGWAQVLADWEGQAARNLGGDVEPADVVVHVGESLAVTNNYEIGRNRDADGNDVTVSIRATNLFRKEDGQWKMIGHHTDLLPFLDQ